MHISFAGLQKSILMSLDIIPSSSRSLNNYKPCLPPVSLPKIHRGVDVSVSWSHITFPYGPYIPPISGPYNFCPSK